MPEWTSPLNDILRMLPYALEHARPAALGIYAQAQGQAHLTGCIGVTDSAVAKPPYPGPYSTRDGEIVIPLVFAERFWAISFGLFVE